MNQTTDEYRDYISPNDSLCLAQDDSASIQNAIALACSTQVRKVVIPRLNRRTNQPIWIIDRSILLPSDITVELDHCHLRMADDVYENMFRNENMYTQIGFTPAGEQHDIYIIGRGNAVLDGGLPNGLVERTSEKDGRPHIRNNNLILLHNVRDYAIENIRCIEPRWWAINQIFCRKGRLSHIDIEARDNIPNQDGIDFRIGCSEITVDHVTGQAGDDLIALTAFPLGSDRDIGTEYNMDWRCHHIHDISIRNVYGTSVTKAVIAIRAVDGGQIYNVDLRNICDTENADPVNRPYAVVRIGHYSYAKERFSTLGEIRNITAENICSHWGCAVKINVNLKDSVFRNIYAAKQTRNAVTVVGPEQPWQDRFAAITGAQLQNVTFDGIFFSAKCTDQGKYSHIYYDTVLDFSSAAPHCFAQNVRIRNVCADACRHVAVVHPNYRLSFEQVNAPDCAQPFVLLPGACAVLDGQKLN